MFSHILKLIINHYFYNWFVLILVKTLQVSCFIIRSRPRPQRDFLNSKAILWVSWNVPQGMNQRGLGCASLGSKLKLTFFLIHLSFFIHSEWLREELKKKSWLFRKHVPYHGGVNPPPAKEKFTFFRQNVIHIKHALNIYCLLKPFFCNVNFLVTLFL